VNDHEVQRQKAIDRAFVLADRQRRIAAEYARQTELHSIERSRATAELMAWDAIRNELVWLAATVVVAETLTRNNENERT
jgi:hypothetical protein